MKIKREFLIVFIMILFNSTYFSTHIKAEDINKRVLFISSYSQSFESVYDQIQGISEVFFPQNIQFDVEYMDTKRIDTQENVDLFFSMLKYKLSVIEPYDALIVGDDSALEFAIEYQEELFVNMPIIFLGVNDVQKGKEAAENKFITGIIEDAPIKENIELALHLNPKATKVVAIIDNSATGIGDKEQFYRNEELFPELTFGDYNISQYTFDQMANILGKIGDDTIILFLNLYTDKTGEYISIDEAAKFFEKNTNVPVYRSSVGGVGKGLLGGKMISYKALGVIAAQMAVDVFKGIPIESIELVGESPSRYVFDYQMIKKFNIDEDLLPEDSILINKELGFYEQYKELCYMITFIILGLLAISVILYRSYYKQKVLRKQISKSHDELMSTYEELAATEEELRTHYTTIQAYANDMEFLNQKYKNSIDCSNSVVWEYNIDNREIYFSDNIKTVFSVSIDYSIGIKHILSQVFEKKIIIKLIDEVRKYKKRKKEGIYIEIPIRKVDDKIIWILIQGRAIRKDTGEISIIHGTITDITKRKEQDNVMEHLAHYDYLTNLPNRGLFMSNLKEKMKAEKNLIIMLMDIDNFKELNDTLGHVYGDKILKVVSQRLLGYINKNIFISRFGGDEFLILMYDGLDFVDELIQDIQNSLVSPIILDNIECNIKFSLGLSRFPEDSTNIDQLIRFADTAMYNVKHRGKDNYQFFNKTMLQKS